MSEFNFDKLKNYEAPQSWAQKVIQTANAQKNQNTYIMRRCRFAVVCMCLVLACMIGLTFCLQVLDGEFIVPVNVAETTDSTKNPQIVNMHINDTENYEDENDETQEAPVIKETKKEKPSETQAHRTEPSDKKNEKESQSTDKIKPTKKPQSQKETQNVSQKPESTQPFVEPTEKPIEDRVQITTAIDKSLISDNTVYCRIYDCDDDVYLGDEDVFSVTHLAEIYGDNDNKYYVSYYPVKKGVITKNGEYIVMFYDKNGKNIKAFGFTVNEF